MRNACKTVLKSKEKHTQKRKSESSDGLRGIVDTDTPRITAQTLDNDLVSVLYLCHSDVQVSRQISVVEMATITIDMFTAILLSTESILKMLLQLGYLTEHSTYQRTLWCITD